MIKSITISNFKSIMNVTNLKFGDTTFIIGKNGAGKSTLISALYLTMKLASKGDLDSILGETAPFGYEIFNQGSRQSHSNFELLIKTDGGKLYKFLYSFSYAREGISFVFSDESLSRVDGENNDVIYERKGGEISAYVAKTKTFETLPLTLKPTELALANYSNPEVKEVADTISRCKVLWFDKTTNETSFKIHSRDGLELNTLDAIAVNLYLNDRKGFDRACHVISQLIPEFRAPEVRSINPSSSEEETEKNKINTRYIVFWREKEIDGLQYTLSGLSDGNFRIIQLIFSMFSSKNSTCLIGEEIENGQHFGRLKTLLEVIKVLSIKLNVQLIFTTHSRDLLQAVSPTDVIYAYKDVTGNSNYEYLNERVNIKEIEEDLGTVPTAKDVLDLGII